MVMDASRDDAAAWAGGELGMLTYLKLRNEYLVNPAEGASRDSINRVSARFIIALEMEESATEASDGDLQRSALDILSAVLPHLLSRLLRSPA
jgi:hypothetical protein